jgi:drug/metabolite transporter (DMT)-like permease
VSRPGARALIVMLGAIFVFCGMDAGLKLLAPHYPAMQVSAMRALASMPLVYTYVGLRWRHARLLQIRWGLQMMRCALGVAMMALYVYALQTLQLTQGYTLWFVGPMLIIILSGPLLGERVTRARWIAFAVGLVGVLVALRPTTTGMITLGGLAMLGSAAAYAVAAIAIRIAGRTDSTESMLFWMITVLGLGATALAWHDWRPVAPGDGWLIAGVGILGFFGQLGITYAFRHGEASAIAPLDYTALVWAAMLDRLVWHTVPDRYTLIGAAIIIGAGWYLIRGEHEMADSVHP